MARPLRIEFPGALYWVTAHAVVRQKLFRDDGEVRDFVARLPDLVSVFGSVFHGFCLLPGRYELLLETPLPNLSRVLHRLHSGYTATVNARRRRRGALLQSRYRAVLVDDPWLLRLSVQLHAAPVREKKARDPWTYPGSSASSYGAGAPLAGLTTDRVLRLAGGRERYARLLEGELSDPSSPPGKSVWRQVVLGDEGLRQRALAAAAGKDVREIAGFGRPREGLTLDDVVNAVSESTGLPAEQIRAGKFQRVLARKAALYLARRFTPCTLREIGGAFGVDYTTVHMAARRVEDLRREDAGVEAFLAGLEAELRSRRYPRTAAPGPEPTTRPRGRKPRKPAEASREGGQLKLF